MKSKSKQLSWAIVLGVALVVASGWLTGWVSAYSPDYYHQVQKNIEIFGRVYQEISKKYVEEIDPATFMKAGIDGMLDKLDPYTVLIEKEDNQELQIMSSGKYGGLGMRIGLRGGWPTVVEPPFDGTPSTKAGIREGDKIIAIDGQSTEDMTITKVASLLRGEIGSEVFLKIDREGEPNPIEFRLIRAEIEVTDVVYSGFVRDGIGLIRLSHFSRNAGKDIEQAIRDLKQKGLKALILDLRSNPGGLLDAAVSVSENFLPKGKLIVSTKGRANGSAQKFVSERDPILEDMPLAVLVNGLSASASEIVTGAIQDHDRGIVIGSKTFGKGLVQTVIPISDDTALKVTTAKYLVPSGRSIQDPRRFLTDPEKILYHPESNGARERTSDKKKSPANDDKNAEEFHTEHGRTVYAGHGILPDVPVKQDSLSQFEIELLRKTMPFQFAVIYAVKHPQLPRDFEVTPEMFEEFKAFLQEKDFKYESEAEHALSKLKNIADRGDYLASISASVEDIRKAVETRKDEEFDRSKEFISEELQEEIAAKLWGAHAEVEASFGHDPVVQKATKLLSDDAEYHRILKFKK